MNGIKLFGKEIQQILKDKKVLIPIIAILFVPLIYGGMFIWSFKDPYAKMSELPVAVVNLDKGATMDGKEMNIGKNLVDNLKDNDSFDFQIVSKKKAMDGLDDLTYYMIIEIPEDFSENATTLLDDSPKKLQLKFMPNDSYNFLASQIGETAVIKIRDSVSAEVSKTYAETMFDTAMKMADGFQSASDATGKLNEGANDLNEGAKTLKDNLQTLAEKSVEFTEGIQTAGDGTKNLTNGAGKLSGGIGQLNDAGSQLLSASKDLKAGTDALYDGINSASTGISTINGKLPELIEGTDKVKNGITSVQAQLPNQLASGLSSQLPALVKQSSIASADEMANQLADFIIQYQQQQLAALQPLIQQLPPEQREQLAGSVDRTALVNQLKQQIIAGINNNSSSTNTNELTGQLAAQIKASTDPVFNQLTAGLQQVQEGQKALQTGISQLAQGSQQLKQGALQLSNGQNQYLSSFGLFTQKLGEAKAGADQLASGANQLNAGMGQLVDGSGQLSSGAGQLAEGSVQLADGINQLQAGTNELNKKLSEAADEASSLHANDKTYDMMASPVEVDSAHINKVPNYGTGFAPYFISLGLFVGALLLTIIFPLVDSAGIPKNGWSWFVSKLAVMVTIGVIQSLFISTLVLYVLDIDVQNVPLFYLFTIFTSLTFITLIQFLVTLGGNPGRFIAILILILQLTSSAGTFPLEVIPKAVQFFNPLLPMTYSVKGFKAVISSGDYSFMWQNAGILAIYIIGSMLISLGYFIWKFNQKYKNNEAEHHHSLSV
ncbi:YhgE/Pip domain-containing protein [Caldibacillus thermoamylovorans]|uniref:YhgE/Pip domain-containing protein n=1 Tax=Caldibacillus thermoamylovorans TaxID=35841 RepID=UPI001D067800|nr:YhgE/Pip domain-containing protein [Caldibacillus thermoamylovorans]MCB5936027.1 YhgE/Pip domain-containing protein [Bacillus sp. DFI.2.34]MCB7076953.1 YhgE/Pip domain-containing protein [Caldibacillus thermoamylovorans]